MIQEREPQPTESNRWISSPVAVSCGRLFEIRRHIPSFERQTLEAVQPGGGRHVSSPHLDVIVRRPVGDDRDFVPIGVVSKEYVLVEHSKVLDMAAGVLNRAGIRSEEACAELRMSAHGERMHLSIYLPEAHEFDPGDGHFMRLRLECINSVDGSTGFRTLLGWFRFVCSNGLVLGVTNHDIRRRHMGAFRIGDMEKVFATGVKEAETEKKRFAEWRRMTVNVEQVGRWAEEHVRKTWGFKAATRAFHIARSGHDVEIVGPYKDKTPTRIATRSGKAVPGSPPRSENRFDLGQVLAWLAKERRDFQEQMAWREQIPGLLNQLN